MNVSPSDSTGWSSLSPPTNRAREAGSQSCDASSKEVAKIRETIQSHDYTCVWAWSCGYVCSEIGNQEK